RHAGALPRHVLQTGLGVGRRQQPLEGRQGGGRGLAGLADPTAEERAAAQALAGAHLVEALDLSDLDLEIPAQGGGELTGAGGGARDRLGHAGTADAARGAVAAP